METREIIISWWEEGSERNSWKKISPEAMNKAMKELKEMYTLGYLRKDPWGTYATVSNTKGEILAKMKEEDMRT